MLKGAIGAGATVLLAFAFCETVLRLVSALGLLLAGGTGFGLSLRFYLLAQRSFGAARTDSVFSFAPLSARYWLSYSVSASAAGGCWLALF